MLEALVISNLILWVVVVFLGVLAFALVRQIGVLYERVAPAGALMLNQTLRPGDAAPELDVLTTAGETLHIGGPRDPARSVLLFFLAPDCPVCKTLLPVLASAQKEEGAWLDIVLASDGDAEQHKKFIAEHKLSRFDYVLSELLGRSYGVGKLPYATLIDEQGKVAAMGIVNSREHLESLFEAKERGVASIQEYVQKHHAAQREAGGEQGKLNEPTG